MCDKICFKKIKNQAIQIRIDEIIKNNENLIFGNRVDLSFLKTFDVYSCCKNCEYNVTKD